MSVPSSLTVRVDLEMVTPAVSSSVTLAVTLPMLVRWVLVYRPPSPEDAIVCVIVVERLSPVLSMSSFLPWTVTVWVLFQLDGVNRICVLPLKVPPSLLTRATLASLAPTLMVTFVSGSLVSTKV